jgi:hypothetical protein
MVAVKPNRITTRISGEKADESRIAPRLAARYASLRSAMRAC